MLKIQNLHVDLEHKPILNGISLSIKPGEIHAVMGPNGSGKSTLAYTLAGHPSYIAKSGNISLDGKSIATLPPNERATLGLFLAFQYPVEIPGVSVQNALRVAYESVHGELESILKFREKLAVLAKTLGVPESLLQRGLNEGFSGGEKKRIEILQMAALKPKYAILDETDSGLDIDAIRAVANGVRKIVRTNKTGVLVITHYQRILRYLKPDFVHVMVQGKILHSGTKEFARELERTGYKQYVKEIGGVAA